jgi:D-glycero-D-manno-heptose 1,7-bisphosphate phosphatase
LNEPGNLPAEGELRPAVFIDRDGTMTVEGGYINHPSRLRLISGTAEAIRLLNQNDVFAVVVTNQAGVARGYFTEDLVHVVHEKLHAMLARKGAALDAIFYCPHHPHEGPPEYRIDCNCRKPRTGMIEAACRQLPIDLSRSYMVGDKISDSEFGHKLGLRTVMVMTGYGRGEYEFQRQEWRDSPDHFAKNLHEAVKWILADLAVELEHSST